VRGPPRHDFSVTKSKKPKTTASQRPIERKGVVTEEVVTSAVVSDAIKKPQKRQVASAPPRASAWRGGHKTDTSGRPHAVTAGTQPFDEKAGYAGQRWVNNVR
jgi:hypothetical protein